MTQKLTLLRSRFGLPAFVLACGLALSAILGYAAHEVVERSAQQRFDAMARDASRKVEDRFDAYTEVLSGLRALFATSGKLSRAQFSQYVAGLKLAQHYPGFGALNYAPRITPEAKAEYERSLRADRGLSPALAARAAVTPPGERAEYHPLAFIEPMAGNEDALGRDLGALAYSQRALDRARDSGGIVSSGQKIQLNGHGAQGAVGLAMRMPVYRADTPLDTLDQRRAAYIGSVGAGFVIAAMMRDVPLGSADHALRVRLYDGGCNDGALGHRIETHPVDASVEALPSKLLFDSAPRRSASAGGTFERTLAFEMAGRTWIVQISQDSAQVIVGLDRAMPWLTVLCGAAISLLLAGIVYSLSNSRQRAEAMAVAMTSDLRKGSTRMRLEHDTARLLLADGEPEAVIPRVLEAICAHLHWDCAALWGVGDDGIARCEAAGHVDAAYSLGHFVTTSRSLSYDADEGSLGRAWASGEPVLVDTAAAHDSYARDAVAGQAGLATGLIVPTVDGSNATALELFSRTQRTVERDTLESLRAIARQLAQYSQRKHAEEALRYMASHDALTGLANRSTLERDLARAIKRSNRHQTRFAVMFVDLDRFKHINDTLGHGVGDALICACAERLSGVLREEDSVARFGGDEFVLLVENLSTAGDAGIVADKVLACCAEPFVLEGRELHVGASIGVSIYPEDGSDGETLLKNADAAMYRAKDKGRGTHEFYAARMNAEGTERLMLENDLRRAIERDELELHYQPKLDLHTERIAGVEALMRWRHPVLGLVSPAQFVPIAEETGLIVAMGKWALRTACADARDWQRCGLPPVQMSVNLSPRQLNNPSLIDDIDEVLSETGLDAALLELEITESAVMKNPEQATELLTQIRAMGVGLAIDDFGTGYSSLSYLTRFPFTTVKIDRSFVNDLSRDRDAEALTHGILTLAHGLRMRVVAEGVESAAQLSYLRAQGCDEIQGFWLSKALPAEQLRQFMASRLRKIAALPVAA